MTDIHDILSDTNHRTFDYPAGDWTYYQEWNRALFLHWKVPVDILQKLIPEQLTLDTFEGSAYVSLVAFTMEKIRPKYLPAVRFISNFDEINLRTYIDNDHKKSVYFLNIEAQKRLSVFIARQLSGLPYEKADMTRNGQMYQSSNLTKGFFLDVNYDIKDLMEHKTALDKWLTERYCLYVDQGQSVFRYDIHHKEWALKEGELRQLHLSYDIGNLHLTTEPDFAHYSEGVQVVAWKKVCLT